jgi:8-oxo-dGTP diphosphatase
VDKIITIIDQQDIYPSVIAGDRAGYFVRHAARAVITDNDGKVALLHARQRDYYKLPGGGVEQNEDIQKALEREIIEEVGCHATVTGELGIVEEWRDFHELHQISHCFVTQLAGDKGTPGFTESEIEEGFEVVWAEDIDSAIGLVESIDISKADLEVKFMTRRDAAILRVAHAQINRSKA